MGEIACRRHVSTLSYGLFHQRSKFQPAVCIILQSISIRCIPRLLTQLFPTPSLYHLKASHNTPTNTPHTSIPPSSIPRAAAFFRLYTTPVAPPPGALVAVPPTTDDVKVRPPLAPPLTFAGPTSLVTFLPPIQGLIFAYPASHAFSVDAGRRTRA